MKTANVRRVTVTFTVSLWVDEEHSHDLSTLASDDGLCEAVERSGEAIVDAFTDCAPMVVAAKDDQEIFGVEHAIGVGGSSGIEVEED